MYRVMKDENDISEVFCLFFSFHFFLSLESYLLLCFSTDFQDLGIILKLNEVGSTGRFGQQGERKIISNVGDIFYVNFYFLL